MRTEHLPTPIPFTPGIVLNEKRKKEKEKDQNQEITGKQSRDDIGVIH